MKSVSCTATSGPYATYRGTSLIRKSPPPEGFHRALGKGLLQGPTEGGGSYERGTPVAVGWGRKELECILM